MSHRTRIPGPIRDITTGNTRKPKEGEGKWISIDVNDPSAGWTKYDPDSTIVSVVTDPTGLRIVQDNAENDERWSASAQGSGRWYKLLIGPYGPLTWNDQFTIEFIIELNSYNANTSVTDRSGVVLGIADSDVTDSQASVNWAGMAGFIKYNSPAGLQGVIGGDTGTTNAQNSSCVKLYGLISPPIEDSDADDNPSTRRTMMFLLDSNNDLRATAQSAEQTHEYTESDNVYLFLAPSYGGTTSGIDDPDGTWKVWYRVNLAPDGLNPVYYPNSGTSG